MMIGSDTYDHDMICVIVSDMIETCAYTFLLPPFPVMTTETYKSTTLSNGYLGSRNDEERSEMRYVMRIAEFSESSNL